MVRNPRRAALAIVAALAVALTGCTDQDPSGTSPKHGVTLVKDGTLTVCTTIPFPPFELSEGGGVTGFDVDLLDLVAKELGVRATFRNEKFEDIRSGTALNAKRCDAAAAGILITPDRQKLIGLSDPYFDLHQGLLVKAGKPYQDLKSLAGKKVGVEVGTTGEAYLHKQIKEQGLKLQPVSYEDLAGLEHAITTGQVEAAMADLPLWTEYAKETPGTYQVAAEFDTGEQYAIAVKNGNSTLLKVINDVVARAMQDGTYDKIYQKWISVDGA
ncbi:MAG: ABC transporter substrate-binding protein [Micromonosporaceae bacterium]